MNELSHFLDSFDLRGVHILISITGALLSVYVMQKTRYEAENRSDPSWLRAMQTAVLGALAMCFLWSLSYGYNRQWEPWPPDVARAFVVVSLLAIRAVAIVLRVRRTGPYREAPSRMAARSNFE